ncbi:hypothetical protein [Pseudomonas piscis]|uniref:hypothetical protein n=1 Tax=Pseudomonas piscis TaxID=2614538 RepID=UPI0021D6072A|nr:hypothetical protein [Pseudomonas piscis]MCU7648593.1 hypothetical protein [Pseudomonas piscis]
MNWGNALKIGGPSIVAAFVFQHLITTYLDKSELFKNNLTLNILLIFSIFIFCLFMGWLWIRNGKKEISKKGLQNNEIIKNEVGGSLNIGKSLDIIDNKISENKVNGDLNIGGKEQ